MHRFLGLIHLNSEATDVFGRDGERLRGIHWMDGKQSVAVIRHVGAHCGCSLWVCPSR